jgi:Ca2+-binding RTX toxin-like protein
MKTMTLEPLEPRALLSSVVLQGRELIVRGEAAVGNNISVGFDAKQVHVILVVNGAQYGFGTHAVSLIDLIGGAGNDWLHVDQSVATFTIRTRFYPQGGDNVCVGGTERDLMICGGAGNDTLYTGDGDDTVIGGAGNDTMVLGNNYKLIFGAKGNNTLTAGHGRGYIFGGNGVNVIRSAGDQREIFGGPGDDVLTGGGFDTLWGGGGHDTLSGGDQRNYKPFGGIAKLKRILFPDVPLNLP